METHNVYIEHLSEPWFTLVSMGLKTYEGRLYKNRFCNFKEGDIIQWINNDFNKRCCFTKITQINIYQTFEDYLNDKGLENCLPGMHDLTHGLDVYEKYYGNLSRHGCYTKLNSEEQTNEEKYGVVAFQLQKVF